MAERVGWGILGTGKIAVKFADDLRHVPGAALTAVGSRSAETAKAFGRRFRIPHQHASYAALVNDPDVDVVYISTPHSLHAENARLALEAGKAVLCEKAFTLNARQAADLIALARERRLFLMEAMWMRFLPAIVHVRQILAEKALGDVRLLSADFGAALRLRPGQPAVCSGTRRRSAARPGRLSRVAGIHGLRSPGHDRQPGDHGPHRRRRSVRNRLPLRRGARSLSLYTAMGAATPTEAVLTGTHGRLRLHAPFYQPDDLTLCLSGQQGPNVSIIGEPETGCTTRRSR